MDIGLIVVAAGYGSFRTWRGRPVPKVLEPVYGSPLITFPLRAALDAGIKDTVIVVNDLFGSAIRKAVRDFGPACKIEYVVQPDRYGSANAVLRAIPALRRKRVQAVLVVYGDMPFWSSESIRALVAAHTRHAAVTMMLAERESFVHIDRYGRVIRDTAGSITRIVEVDVASEVEASGTEVNPSLWIWDLEWLERNIPHIEPVVGATPGRPEQHLPPLVAMAYQQGRQINEVHLPALRHYEALGVNTSEELDRARAWWNAA